MSGTMELKPAAAAPARRRGRPRKDAPVIVGDVELLSSEERVTHNAEVAALRANIRRMGEAARDITLILDSIGRRMEAMQGMHFKKLRVDDYVRLLGITPPRNAARPGACIWPPWRTGGSWTGRRPTASPACPG